MSAGDLGRLEIVLGIRNAVPDELNALRGPLQQQVNQFAQGVAASGGGARAGAGAGHTGGPAGYNPHGSSASVSANELATRRLQSLAQVTGSHEWYEIAHQQTQRGLTRGQAVDYMGQQLALRAQEHARRFAADDTARTGFNRAIDDVARADSRHFSQQQTRDQDRQNRDVRNYELDQQRAQDRQRNNENVHQRDNQLRQNTQHRQETGYEREHAVYARGLERAQFNETVSQAWTNRGRARLYEQRAAQLWGGGDPVTPAEMELATEAAQMRSRGQNERRGGFFGRPSGRVIAMQAMFGGWELGRAAQGWAMGSSPLATSPEQRMQMQQQGIAMIGGGVYGAMALGALHGLDALSTLGGAAPPTGRGYGIVGQFSPMAAAYAQAQALQGIKAVNANTAAYASELQIKTQSRLQVDMSAASMLTSPYNRKMEELGVQYQSGIQEDKDMLAVLDQQIQDARSSGDADALAAAKSQKRLFTRTTGARRSARDATLEAGQELAGRDLRRFKDTSDSANRSRAQAMRGFSLSAAILAVDAEFQAQFTPTGLKLRGLSPGDPEYENTKTAYDQAQHEAHVTERREQITAATSAAVTHALLGNRPLQAQLEASLGTFYEETEGMHPLSPDFQRAAARWIQRDDLARHEWKKQGDLLDLDVNNRTKQMGILTNPTINVGTGRIMAAATGAAGGAIMEMTQLSQNGMLTQNRKDDLTALAINQQQYMKREYLDSFRGEQLDFGYKMVSPRDQENPGEILSHLDQTVAEINRAVQDIQVQQ